MAGKLQLSRSTSLVSPLIDVVLGAFLALFVLFSAFIILSRPCPTPERVHFLRDVALPPAIEGQSYIFTFPVAGGSGRRRFDLTGDLSEDLAFETGSGTIYGYVQPSLPSTTRDLLLTATVQDSSGSDRVQVRLPVVPVAVPFDPADTELQLLPPPGALPPARVGRDYSATFGALGGVEPYRWSATGFPRELQIRNGVLAGVPTRAGAIEGAVLVEHSAGRFRYRDRLYEWVGGRASGGFALLIHEPLRLNERLPRGRVGEPYLATVTSDSLLPDEEVEWDDLPPGLEVGHGGALLTGVPAEAGEYSVRYRVRAGGKELASGAGEIKIVPRVEPQIGPVTLQTWVGESTRQLLPVRGLVEPLRLGIEGELPPGLEIRGGFLIGIPRQSGLATIRLTAIDSAGTSVHGSITIRVGPRF